MEAHFVRMEKMDRDLLRRTSEQVLAAVNSLGRQQNVANLREWDLHGFAAPHANITKYGSYAFSTTIRSRSAAQTVYIGSPRVQQKKLNPKQQAIVKNLPTTLEKVHAYLKKAPFIKVERRMGANDIYSPRCDLYFSHHARDNIRIPLMWCRSLFEPDSAGSPLLRLVYIPEWPDQHRQILVFPEIGITYVLGSDYFGEAKKGFLRMAMWFAKQQGMLGVHAGTKIVHARDAGGTIRRLVMLIFGLSGTGKTTHTCHHHDLNQPGENVWICQDDFPILQRDGSLLGTERGFFIKTDSLTPESQPVLWRAACQPHALFENVLVDFHGKVDFLDETLSANGRGIVLWEDMDEFKADSIDSPPAEEIDGVVFAINTRRHDVVPIASRLTLPQLAAFFALGESVRTAADDPTKVGESVRVVGTDPFIVGDEAEHVNRFYEILQAIGPEKVHGYLLNTGGSGELYQGEGAQRRLAQKVKRVEIVEMAGVIRNILRGTVEWEKEPYFSTEIPSKMADADVGHLDPSRFYDAETRDRLATKLRQERIEYLEAMQGLHPDILKAVKSNGKTS